eukprot:2925231-Pleurochrysis_carterae.AAC.1
MREVVCGEGRKRTDRWPTLESGVGWGNYGNRIREKAERKKSRRSEGGNYRWSGNTTEAKGSRKQADKNNS